MEKKIILFIILIRAIAAIVITNAHYTGVYPTDLIANGGLLGDVLFFSVSGFCINSTNHTFYKWYLKRFIRIYIPVWLITVIYLLIGAYQITDWKDFFLFFCWPTHWHFVASIILLYIPLFFVSNNIEMNKKNYWILAISLFIAQLIIYFTIYDLSHYHIDKVREPMIEFIFFQSMIMGLHFKWKSNHCIERNKLSKVWQISLCILLLAIYFVSKILFVKEACIAQYQIINQIILLILLFVLFNEFMRLEPILAKSKNSLLWKCVNFISDRALEIYLVQYVILDHCKIGPFPINWVILTGTIFGSAIILRWLSQQIITRISI